jgi:hypothetical protein
MAAVLHDLSLARCATAPQRLRVSASHYLFCLFNGLSTKCRGVTAITVILGNWPYSVKMNSDTMLAGHFSGGFAVARWLVLGRSRAVDGRRGRCRSSYAEDCGIIRQIVDKEFGRRLLSKMEFGCSQPASAVRGKFSSRLKRIFEPNLGPAIHTGIQGR